MGLVGGGAVPAAAAPRQDPTATTALDPTATTAPTATGLAPTTTAAVTTTTAAAGGPDTDKVAEEDRKIWLVVGGLVAVAIALLLLTIRYWRHTKPVPLDAAPVAADDAAAPSGRRGRRGERGRHSRRAVAGADHATADEGWEPRGTGEHQRTEAPSAATSSRPTAEQRAAAYAAATRQR
ncbi:hypothetical protein BH10ACT1_BH10ACT1_37500 [soil metagenome]